MRVLHGRRALLLCADDGRGWFGGISVVAWDPVEVRRFAGVRPAAATLDAAFASSGPSLAAALLDYEGGAVVASYAGGLLLFDDGWYEWGEPPADSASVGLQAAKRAVNRRPPPDPTASLLTDPSWDDDGHSYRSKVRAVQERIARGDVYVLNLTARLSGTLADEPAEVFSALQERARASMAAWFRPESDGRWIASVSPERFVSIAEEPDGRRIAEICPIKGTRPRGVSADEDARLARQLVGDEKERAEHVMIVDLERNDLGVACVPGSVVVDPLLRVVETPYCHQLVSSVRGMLRSESGVADVIDAAFPCGSITGAPKLAAMRIAEQLESGPRGAYCGSLVVAVPGRLDSSVLIRTLEGADDRTGTWGAGAGITCDSDPAAEWLETLLKASPVSGNGSPPIALRETVRVQQGTAPLIDYHLARLAQGGCGPTLLAAVREAVFSQLRSLSDETHGRLGITVTPDGEVSCGFDTAISTLCVEGGPRLVAVEVSEPSLLPPHAAKPAARAYWDRAHRRARMRGGDQAALLDREGTVIDGSTANVWVVSGGTLVTPPSPPAISGVARDLVRDIAARLGIHVAIRPVRADELEAADEVFLTNAHGGVAAVRGRGGPVTEAIRAEFEAEVARRAAQAASAYEGG